MLGCIHTASLIKIRSLSTSVQCNYRHFGPQPGEHIGLGERWDGMGSIQDLHQLVFARGSSSYTAILYINLVRDCCGTSAIGLNAAQFFMRGGHSIV